MSILLREDDGPVARVTLNRPDALNALSGEMLAALQDMFDGIAADPALRVVVLAATGRAFCAGHDLGEMTAIRGAPDGGVSGLRALFDTCSRLMQTIPRMPQPVIAEVHGLATAAGCQLVASCDLAVASDQAKFGVNGVNIGLFCSTPMVALSRNVPRKQAFEMLTTGDFITAARAREIGLVNRAVAATDLRAETDALAATIAAKLGAAVKIGKRAFYDQLGLPLDQAYLYTGDVMVENMADPDTAEGIRAFLEKRDPEWSQ